MLDELAATQGDTLTYRQAAVRVWTAACTFGALAALIFVGWNAGLLHHVDLPPIDAQTALGDAAVVCVIRYGLGLARRRAGRHCGLSS